MMMKKIKGLKVLKKHVNKKTIAITGTVVAITLSVGFKILKSKADKMSDEDIMIDPNDFLSDVTEEVCNNCSCNKGTHESPIEHMVKEHSQRYGNTIKVKKPYPRGRKKSIIEELAEDM